MKIFVDFETYSELNIKKVGAYAYAAHPSTEILCMAYQIDGGHTSLWLPGDPLPNTFRRKGIELHGWNVFFEWCIWTMCGPDHQFPQIDPEAWRDTMALAAYFGLPLDLFRASRVASPDMQKDKRGSYLISVLCKPVKPTKKKPFTRLTPENSPELFLELYDYCKLDVQAEKAVHNFLPRQNLPPMEQAIWKHNFDASIRGTQVDMKLANQLIKLRDENIESVTAEFKESMGFNPTQIEMLRLEVGLPNVQKQTLIDALEGELPDKHRRALEIRQVVSLTSLKKLDAMILVVVDGKAHGMQVYYGAHTGRYAGRLIQLHNMTKAQFKVLEWDHDFVRAGCNLDTLEMLYGDPGPAISTLIRGCMTASKGKYLYIADYSSIEARILAWLAGQEDLLKLFREGKDVYVDAAMDIYGCTEEEAWDDTRRALGKVQVLGCGFQMGKERFFETCREWGVPVERELSDLAVTRYRERNKNIVELWHKVNNVFTTAVRTPNRIFNLKHIKVVSTGKWLFVQLPSGRTITYPLPRIDTVRKDFGKWVEVEKEGVVEKVWEEDLAWIEQITYMGLDSTTKQWRRQETYGGKLVENMVQGIARDIMCEAQLRIESEGFDFLFCVHDEIISEAEDPGELDRYMKLMTVVPEWASKGPGLPVGATGDVCRRFKK
jgi:DNA polymerase